MFLKLNANKLDLSLTRLVRSGVSIEGAVEVTESGIRMGVPRFDDNERLDFVSLVATGVVQVRKHCVAVEVNPQLSELLGFQPGGPQYLHPGWFGEVEFVFPEVDQGTRDMILELPWLVELHFVLVSHLGD